MYRLVLHIISIIALASYHLCMSTPIHSAAYWRWNNLNLLIIAEDHQPARTHRQEMVQHACERAFMENIIKRWAPCEKIKSWIIDPGIHSSIDKVSLFELMSTKYFNKRTLFCLPIIEHIDALLEGLNLLECDAFNRKQMFSQYTTVGQHFIKLVKVLKEAQLTYQQEVNALLSLNLDWSEKDPIIAGYFNICAQSIKSVPKQLVEYIDMVGEYKKAYLRNYTLDEPVSKQWSAIYKNYFKNMREKLIGEVAPIAAAEIVTQLLQARSSSNVDKNIVLVADRKCVRHLKQFLLSLGRNASLIKALCWTQPVLDVQKTRDMSEFFNLPFAHIAGNYYCCPGCFSFTQSPSACACYTIQLADGSDRTSRQLLERSRIFHSLFEDIDDGLVNDNDNSSMPIPLLCITKEQWQLVKELLSLEITLISHARSQAIQEDQSAEYFNAGLFCSRPFFQQQIRTAMCHQSFSMLSNVIQAWHYLDIKNGDNIKRILLEIYAQKLKYKNNLRALLRKGMTINTNLATKPIVFDSFDLQKELFKQMGTMQWFEAVPTEWKPPLKRDQYIRHLFVRDDILLALIAGYGGMQWNLETGECIKKIKNKNFIMLGDDACWYKDTVFVRGEKGRVTPYHDNSLQKRVDAESDINTSCDMVKCHENYLYCVKGYGNIDVFDLNDTIRLHTTLGGPQPGATAFASSETGVLFASQFMIQEWDKHSFECKRVIPVNDFYITHLFVKDNFLFAFDRDLDHGKCWMGLSSRHTFKTAQEAENAYMYLLRNTPNQQAVWREHYFTIGDWHDTIIKNGSIFEDTRIDAKKIILAWSASLQSPFFNLDSTDDSVIIQTYCQKSKNKAEKFLKKNIKRLLTIDNHALSSIDELKFCVQTFLNKKRVVVRS